MNYEARMSLVIEGKPLAWQRAFSDSEGRRHTRREVADWERLVGSAAAVAAQKAGFPTGPGLVSVSVAAYFFWPTGTAYRLRGLYGFPMGKRPDGDNILKGIKDALTGPVYDDDGVVWQAQVEKYRVPRPEHWPGPFGPPGPLAEHTRVTLVRYDYPYDLAEWNDHHFDEHALAPETVII